mmetsp:Transcript_17765/g.30174  ORF Transcript_17765/g.30174 Transcript_17765/m.30174 type:complete len:113 (+) Transcript_17765:108-446(+)
MIPTPEKKTAGFDLVAVYRDQQVLATFSIHFAWYTLASCCCQEIEISQTTPSTNYSLQQQSSLRSSPTPQTLNAGQGKANRATNSAAVGARGCRRDRSQKHESPSSTRLGTR